jgi:hypothetical protein
MLMLVGQIALGQVGCSGDGEVSPPAETCSLSAGELLITEVMANPNPSDPSVEWFEIYSASSRAIELTGVVLEAGTQSNPRVHAIPSVLDPGIQPGAFLVVGSGTLGDGITGYSWPKMVLANDGATIRIRCGQVVIDEVVYGAGAAGPGKANQGVSWQLSSSRFPASGATADQSLNDFSDVWCLSEDEAVFSQAGDRGSPGAWNRECPGTGDCLDGDVIRVPVHPVAGDLVITEVFANSRSAFGSADDKRKEWIEIHALRDVDLVGMVVENRNGTTTEATTKSYPIESASCLRLAAGSWGLLAGSADPEQNGHLPAVLHAFEEGFLPFYGSNAEDLATISILDANGNVLSRAVHPTCTEGASLNLMPEHCSNPPAAEDPLNWCSSLHTGSFDGLGTPGAPNAVCP